MAHVRFEVHHHFSASPRQVWDELIDWSGHGAWIPATRVVVDPGDPTAVGATFTAWTGFGRLALEDRMRVSACEWDADLNHGSCQVDKLGPVLHGTAGFTIVAGSTGGAELAWIEDVTIRRIPQLVAPLLARIGAAGFRQGMRRLARKIGS
jgi:Polyketide cyclase / dehydrase and lipid transport